MDSIDAPSTVVRSVVIPVAAPADLSWKEFNRIANPAFKLSTELANWCVHTLFRLDQPNVAKCPDAVKKAYLYDLAKKGFPDWAERCDKIAISLASMIEKVKSKYIAERWAVMFRHENDLLSYRYPQPFSVHNTQWDLGFENRCHKIGARVQADENTLKSMDNNNAPIFSLNLPGHSGVRLRLRQGGDFARQLGMATLIVSGVAKKGEAAIYQNRKGDMMVKMVGHFPVKDRSEREREHACLLTTQPNALLCAEVDGRSVTITNGDDLVRAMTVVRALNDRHRRFRQRAGEDKKYEVRMDRRKRANYDQLIRERCAKQADRMSTAIEQIAAQTARFIDRQNVGLVVYDDRKRDYIRNVEGDLLTFPWFEFANQLRSKLHELGVVCIFPPTDDSKSESKQEYEKWLTERKALWATALCLKRKTANITRAVRPHPAVTTRNAK